MRVVDRRRTLQQALWECHAIHHRSSCSSNDEAGVTTNVSVPRLCTLGPCRFAKLGTPAKCTFFCPLVLELPELPAHHHPSTPPPKGLLPQKPPTKMPSSRILRGWHRAKVFWWRHGACHHLIVVVYLTTFFMALRGTTFDQLFHHLASFQQQQRAQTRQTIELVGFGTGLLQDLSMVWCLMLLLTMVDVHTQPRPPHQQPGAAVELEPTPLGDQRIQQQDSHLHDTGAVYVCVMDDPPSTPQGPSRGSFPQRQPQHQDSVVPSPSTRQPSGDSTLLVYGHRSIPCLVFRFAVYVILFAIAVFPFCADNVVFRARQLRFTWDFLSMYLRERKFTADFALEQRENDITRQMLMTTSVVAVVFGLVGALWVDLLVWSPTSGLAKWMVHSVDHGVQQVHQWWLQKRTPKDPTTDATKHQIHRNPSSLENGVDTNTLGSTAASSSSGSLVLDEPPPSRALPAPFHPMPLSHAVWKWIRRKPNQVWILQWLLYVGFLVLLLCVTHAVSFSVDRVSAAIALNTSLSEYLHRFFGVQFMPPDATIEMTSSEMQQLYLDAATEEYELTAPESLYRRTIGFKGDLAFDVQVDPQDPPNVLLINVESFRFHDSLYLANNSRVDPLRKTSESGKMSLTPEFDKWASRNIGFRNLWSNWATSRAIEAILFGHAAYDSTVDSLTSTGRKKLKLQGMPQFFKQRGYDCVFSTASRDSYDQWNKFLPAHGFERFYYGGQEYKHMAQEAGYDVSKGGLTWRWGLHDDLSFELLGNMLEKRHQQQQEERASNGTKKPFFMNHYTISSHTPFKQRPDWYDEYIKHNQSFPDFSAMYKDGRHQEDVKNYVEMRYFTDMALGKFLDRMKDIGLLNDTIVVIAGDHGQAPENGLGQPALMYLAAHHVAGALIAEGRLSKYAGTVVDDLAHHNDLLNTLADIVGPPAAGFYQTSIGRSLKRKPGNATERIVHVSNPMGEYALIQNNVRVQYDKTFDTVHVHEIDKDPKLLQDLYNKLYEDHKSRDAIHKLRNAGRFINAYFRHRVHHNCVVQGEC